MSTLAIVGLLVTNVVLLALVMRQRNDNFDNSEDNCIVDIAPFYESEGLLINIPREIANELFQNRENNERVLVLRISERFCRDCVEVELEKFENIASQMKNRQFLIISSFASERSLMILNNSVAGNIKVIGIDFLPLTIEEAVSPYFFILDNNLVARSFFLPHIAKGHITSTYLSLMLRLYF